MKHNGTSPFGSDEQALFEFGDTIAGDQGRTPDNDLEATVVRVQHALRGSTDGPESMPDALRTQIWEDIMASASAETIEQGTVTSWSTPASRRKPGKRQPVRAYETPQHVPYRRMMWSSAANIALVLLILLAGFGTWRVFDGASSFGGGGDDGPPTVPGLAMQPSTPEQREAPLVVAPSPEATPEPFTACDLSSDIPYFPDVEQSPIEATSLYLTNRDPISDDLTGDLMLHCPEEPEDIELAERVMSASAGPIPGVVRLSLLPEDTAELQAQYPAYLNLITGQTVDFGLPPEAVTQHDWFSIQSSPWMVGSIADNPEQVQIVNLRTMESRLLADLSGVDGATDAGLTGIGDAVDGTTVLAYTNPYTGPGEGGTLMTDIGAPGDLMVLGEDFNSIRWIDLPDSLEYVRNIWLSPDGSTIALSVYDGPTQLEDALSYALISAEDGTLLGQSEPITTPGNPLALWIQDSEAIVYIAGSELQTLSTSPGSQPQIAMEFDQPLSSLQTTHDSDVVVVASTRDHGTDAPDNQTDRDVVYSVNVATGDVWSFEGRDASGTIGWITQAGMLVMYEPQDGYPETITYTMIDPVSGEEVGTIADAPYAETPARTLPTLGPRSISITPDGTTEVIALGTQHIYMMEVTDDGPRVRQIASPGWYAEAFLTATVILSPDGSMLSLSGEEDEGRTRYLLPLNAQADEWVEVPSTVADDHISYILFIAGTGD